MLERWCKFSDKLDVKWNKCQLLLADAIQLHQWLMFRSKRRKGTTFALCGLVASIVLEYPHDATPINIVIYTTTQLSASNKQSILSEFVQNRRNPAVTVTILSDANIRLSAVPDLIILDDFEWLDPKIFHIRTVPLLMEHKHTRVVLTYTNPNEFTEVLKDHFHCIHCQDQ